VSGITVVSSRNERPGTTSLKTIWRVPCLVFIVPVVPATNGPLRVIACTSGFQSCQVDVSDQSFQTAWGLAEVSTERSCVAIGETVSQVTGEVKDVDPAPPLFVVLYKAVRADYMQRSNQ